MVVPAIESLVDPDETASQSDGWDEDPPAYLGLTPIAQAVPLPLTSSVSIMLDSNVTLEPNEERMLEFPIPSKAAQRDVLFEPDHTALVLQGVLVSASFKDWRCESTIG